MPLCTASSRNCKPQVHTVRLSWVLRGNLAPWARETTEAWTQLATRIPKPLHRELKLHCVTAETSVMDFVTKAIEEKLGAPVVQS
jgi:hypothetical protein